MAYTINRKQRIQEVLELRDESGKIAHTLKVNLEVDEVAPRLYKAKKELLERQNSYAELQSEEALAHYGEAIVTFFQAILGEENTEIILDFYDNRYTELLLDMLPFVTEVIYPRLNEIEAQKIAQIKSLRKRFK